MNKESSSSEQREFEEYSTIDPFAIISLIASLLSISIVFLSTFFLFIAIIAIGAGIVSLIRIRFSDGLLAGKMVAIVGLSIALFFAATQLTYIEFRKNALYNTSLKFANEWIGLIQDGELNKAHQLVMLFQNREPVGTDLERHYGDPAKGSGPVVMTKEHMAMPPMTERNMFFDRPGARILRDYGKDCKVEHVKLAYYHQENPKVDRVVHIFNLTYAEDGQEKTEELHLALIRYNLPDPIGVHWAIDNIQTATERSDFKSKTKRREQERQKQVAK